MKQNELLDALVQLRRIGNLLNEVLDISRQMAEAVDRNDQVSVRMIIAMRAEPIQKLKAADRALRRQCDALRDPEDASRLAALLNGEPALSREEEPLAERVAANRRLLEQAVALDRVLNLKLTREKSIYR